MPKNEKKPTTSKPAAKPAAASKPAANKQMDADLEAKRSGPPAETRGPKPMADPDAGFPEPAHQDQEPDHAADATLSIEEIDAKLTDPTFDPEGHERLRLAEESMHRPPAPEAPKTPFVDEHGDPQPVGERNPERKT